MSDAPAPTSLAPPYLSGLRILAALGYLVMFGRMRWDPTGSPAYEFTFFAIGTGLGAAVLLLAFPRGTARVLRNLDLLVPFGVYQITATALAVLPIQAAVFQLNAPLSLFESGLLAVAVLLLGLLLHVIFVVWQTLAIVRAVDDENPALVATLGEALRLWPRGLAIVTLTFAIGIAPLLAQIWLSSPLPMGPFATLLVVWSLAWSLLSLAWLPLALDRERPLVEALQHAVQASLLLRTRFLWRLIAWAGALGVVTFHSYTIDAPGNYHSTASWNVAAKWLGGYPYDCGWYDEIVDEGVALSWYAAPLLAVFLTLAIAVKCEVVRALRDDEAGGLLR